MKKNNLFIYSFFVFVSVFSFYLRYAQRWGIEADDYGFIYSGKVSSFNDVKSLFRFVDFESVSHPSNCAKRAVSFYNVYYRPLARFFIAFQEPFFKDNPMGYYFVIIFLLAVISAMLFFIFFSYSKNVLLAFWASLFFAFHLSIPSWMGRVSTQNYLFTMFFCILSVIYFLKNKNKASYFFYALALFSFEGVLFLPIFFSTLFFIRDFLSEKFYLNLKKGKKLFLRSLGFWFITIIFFLLRIIFFDLAFSSGFFSRISIFFRELFYPNFATLFYEIVNINIPSGNFLFKSFIGFFILIGFSFLFYKSKYKKVILYFIFIFVFSVWPLFFLAYRSRYIFYSLPFFIFFLLVLIKDFYIKNKLIIGLLLFALLFYNIRNAKIVLDNKVDKIHQYYLAYKDLLKYKDVIKNRNLCFIGVPTIFYSNLAQFLWLNNLNLNNSINLDGNSLIKDSSTKTNLFIKPIEKGFELKLLILAGGEFLEGGTEERLSMGNFKYYEDRNYLIRKSYYSEKYLNQNMLFITWDYQNSRFNLLDKKPL